MRFSAIIFLTLAAAAQEAVAASCRIADFKSDSCWGGSNGQDACLRQRGGANVCRSPGESSNFCRNVNKAGTQTKVSATCNADCCDTNTGFGIGCPK